VNNHKPGGHSVRTASHADLALPRPPRSLRASLTRLALRSHRGLA